MKKYVICYPEGGLNDMFCRIQHCFKYCKATNRTLIIDTFNSTSFKDDFSIYFNVLDDCISTLNTKNGTNNALSSSNSIFPKIDDFKTSKVKYVLSQGFVLTDNPNIKITFDDTKKYEETVLLYQQCGGGNVNMELFHKFCFTKLICEMLFERINQIPTNYTGFHYRGTDVKTDPEIAFSVLKNIDGPVFLASDSYSLIETAKTKLGEKIFTFSNIPNFLGEPFHYKLVNSNLKRQFNCDAILDLIMLSLAKDVILPPNQQSGFSVLAKNFNKTVNISCFETISQRLTDILMQKHKQVYELKTK